VSRLDWPRGWDRTPARQREKNPRFDASIATTTDALATEMDRMDVDEWRGSIGNAHTKSSGLPLHNAKPDDPGFVLRWTDDGTQFAVACDAYSRLRDNLRSVYLWIHETRMRSQRPVKTGDTEFAAARLPSGDEDAVAATAPPHEVLEVAPDAGDAVVKAAYREKAKSAHPDQGGDPAEWRRINEAKESMLEGERQ